MKFSILVAHYNNWDYFQSCYESIKAQTYTNYEIVIVDDFSNDESYEKLKALAIKDQKIKLFRNEQNLKVGYTKYRCIEEATGEICGFLDPDDLISSDALEESIKAYHDINVVATYSKIKLIDSEGVEKGNFNYSRKIKNNDKMFFNVNFEVAHFFTFRKNSYELTEKIDKSLIICEDQDLYMKLYEIGNFKFINKFLYKYRIHDKGVSQNKNKSDKQRADWNIVIYNTCKRRQIKRLYGKDIQEIEYLPKYLFEKENTFLKKIIRKLFK